MKFIMFDALSLLIILFLFFAYVLHCERNVACFVVRSAEVDAELLFAR